jgi:hypothetical protein
VRAYHVNLIIAKSLLLSFQSLWLIVIYCLFLSKSKLLSLIPFAAASLFSITEDWHMTQRLLRRKTFWLSLSSASTHTEDSKGSWWNRLMSTSSFLWLYLSSLCCLCIAAYIYDCSFKAHVWIFNIMGISTMLSTVTSCQSLSTILLVDFPLSEYFKYSLSWVTMFCLY